MDPLSKFAKRANRVLIAKDQDADSALWEQLIAIADSIDPRIRQAFIESVTELQAKTDSAEVLLFIRQESPEAAANQILAGVYGGFDGLHEAMSTAIRTALLGVSDSDFYALSVDIDPESPQAVSMIQDYVLGAVRNISDEQRNVITERIREGLVEGLNPHAIALQIRPYIGLTHSQNATVDNFRALLEANDPGSLDRELRDRRYDESIQAALESGDGLTPDQIDNMVRRYAERTLQFRSNTIARTESMNAIHQAQAFTWQQAADQGKIVASDMYRYWHVAHDERTCPICMPIPEMNPDGVPLNGTFETPVGEVDGPTMHPNCRCVVFIRPHIGSLYNTDPSRLVDELRARGSVASNQRKGMDVLSKFNTAEARDAHGRWTLSASQTSSLNYYAHNGFLPINQSLRGKKPESEKTKTVVADLDTLLKESRTIINSKTMVYRGINKKGFDSLRSKLKVGNVVTDNGFVSTSLKQYSSLSFTGINTTSILARITLPKGTHALPMDSMLHHHSEAEMLLPRGSKFKIDAVSVSDDRNGKVYHVDMTLIGTSAEKVVAKGDSSDTSDANRFIWNADDLNVVITKFNPNHDARGEFASVTGPSMMAVEHYSAVPGLDMLDPEKAGSGRVGREAGRKTRIGAVHVYDSKAAKLESQFRNDYRYTGSVPRSAIYDIGEDPDGLIPKNGLYDPTKLEHDIKQQGYMGFRNSGSANPSIIKLFYSLPVKAAAPRTYRGQRFGSSHQSARRLVAMKSWFSHKVVSLRDPLSRF